MDSPILEMVTIAVLMILNGVFSAGEIAIVSSRKSKIQDLAKDRTDKKADTLLKMKERPERFLSAVQIGITFFGTLGSAIGGILAIEHLQPLLMKAEFLRPYAQTISVAIAVVILTYFFLLVGEMIPRYVGMNYRERVALAIVPLFAVTAKIFFFAVNFLTASTMLVVRGFKIQQKEEHIGEGEIKTLLQEGRRKGIFDKTEEELIHGVFDFAHRTAKEIMVAKPNIYAIDIEAAREKVLNYVVENEFSRYPVYRETLDNIVGIVYHKDITRHIWTKETFAMESLLKKPFFVPDTVEISILLKEMQKRHTHMAVVVDEYGTTAGIVTLEDIIEEIFGEIMDETDVDDRIERLPDGSVVIDAACSIRDLNHMMGLGLAESPDYETLGGFILDQLQGIARGGEIVYHDAYKFTIVDVEGVRLKKIKLERSKTRPRKKEQPSEE